MTAPLYSAPLAEVTTAVLELLQSTGRAVYDGAYAGSATKPTYPYAVLYRIPGGSSDPLPDLDGEAREVTVAYQVTVVSNLRNQCEATATTMRDRILARAGGAWVYGFDVPAGWQVIARTADIPPGVDPVGDPPARVFNCPVRFTLTLAPA